MKKLFYSLFLVALFSLSGLFTTTATANAQGYCQNGNVSQCTGNGPGNGMGQRQGNMRGQGIRNQSLKNNVDSSSNLDTTVFQRPRFNMNQNNFQQGEFISNCIRMNNPNYLMQ